MENGYFNALGNVHESKQQNHFSVCNDCNGVRLSHPQNVGELSMGVVKYDIYTICIYSISILCAQKQISQQYE